MQPSLRDSTNVPDRLQFRATITGISDVCVERRKPHSDPLAQPASYRGVPAMRTTGSPMSAYRIHDGLERALGWPHER